MGHSMAMTSSGIHLSLMGNQGSSLYSVGKSEFLGKDLRLTQ